MNQIGENLKYVLNMKYYVNTLFEKKFNFIPKNINEMN